MSKSKLDKVIQGLKCCFSDGINCDSCPYNDLCGYRPREEGILADALALLKEQQKRIETLESLRRIEQEGR